MCLLQIENFARIFAGLEMGGVFNLSSGFERQSLASAALRAPCSRVHEFLTAAIAVFSEPEPGITLWFAGSRKGEFVPCVHDIDYQPQHTNDCEIPPGYTDPPHDQNGKRRDHPRDNEADGFRVEECEDENDYGNDCERFDHYDLPSLREPVRRRRGGPTRHIAREGFAQLLDATARLSRSGFAACLSDGQFERSCAHPLRR